MRIGVLSNPTSHSNKAAMPDVRALVAAHSDVIHHEIQAITDVPGVLHGWAGQDLNLLVVNGGDGTVQAVMTEIINRDPFGRPMPIAVVPGGKTNMFAIDLGGAGRPPHVLKRVLDLAESGSLASKVIQRPLVGLRRVPGEPVVYGTFFGTAAVVRGVEYCRAHVYPLGLPNIVSHTIASAIIIGGSLSRTHGPDSPFRAEDIALTLNDSQRLSGHYFLIIVSSFERLILGARPFSHQGEGQLNFFGVEHAPGTIVGATLKALVLRPKEFSARGTTSRRVAKADLTLECPVMLDGEFFYPEPNVPIQLTGDRSLPFVELR